MPKKKFTYGTLGKRPRIKALSNEYQSHLDSGFPFDRIFGYNYSIQKPFFNKVGFYSVQTGTDYKIWYEFQLKDGTMIAVHPSNKETCKQELLYRISLDRTDLPSKEACKNLKEVKRKGFKFSKDVEERLRLAIARDSYLESKRASDLRLLQFKKRVAAHVRARSEKEAKLVSEPGVQTGISK